MRFYLNLSNNQTRNPTSQVILRLLHFFQRASSDKEINWLALITTFILRKQISFGDNVQGFY